MPPAATKQQTSNVTKIDWPPFWRKCNEEYKAGNAHVFVLAGNINDYQDNHGRLASLRQLLMAAADDHYTEELLQKKGISVQVQDVSQRGIQQADPNKPKRICAIYVANEGLKFDSDKSRALFVEILSREYQTELKANRMRPDFLQPFSFEAVLFTLSKWFEASKKIALENRRALREGTTLKSEAAMTVLFKDCDGFFPAGNIATLNADRLPIIFMRNWAQDKEIGLRNRIILLTRHTSEIHESLRGGTSGISTINVPKPSFEDREEFSQNFCDNLAEKCRRMKLAGDPLVIDGKEVEGVKFAEGFDHHGVAVQSAGMSRVQIEKAFNEAVSKHIPVDDSLVRSIKQKAVEEESGGTVEFEHPEVGFDKVGGHEEIKEYCRRKVIAPLRAGDARTCSKGFLVVGPGGTGKTWFGMALAYEAGVNFLKINLSKLYNGVVGGTEQATAKIIEMILAAAPCIAFFDEFDTVMSQGRQSQGDSGTSARMFGSMLTFFGDESRAGKVVIMAATNRPDLLDGPLIRAGRFDAILPMLAPPMKGPASETGRANILNALVKKRGIKFDDSMKETMKDPLNGLGKLLKDDTHIWTGAEIEVVLKESMDSAIWDKSKVITVDHWNDAMDGYIPNTGEIERMTWLALKYVNFPKYSPPEYRELVRDKARLEHLLKGGQDYGVDTFAVA